MDGHVTRRLQIARLLHSSPPPDAPSADDIVLTDALVRSALSTAERATWKRIRKILGANRISISRVRRVLTPEDQDALYGIIQKTLPPNATPNSDADSTGITCRLPCPIAAGTAS